MVTRVFSVLYKEIKGLHQAAYVLALFTFASQILAIVRDRTLAHQFGADIQLDIYYAAFRIPDILFVLFASVLSVYVLLPFVARAEAESRRESGQMILSQMFTLFLLAYSIASALILFFLPTLVLVLYPGYSPTVQAEISHLMSILMWQPLLLGLSSLVGVITQMQHRFIIYAVSPLLYNAGIIIGATLFYDWYGMPGLAYGVILGAFGHLAVQLPLLTSRQIMPTLTMTFNWLLLKEIFMVAVPRALTLSLHQIQFMVFVALGSVMAVGSVAVLQLSFNLQAVPLAIIGVSYSVAAFPTLASLLSNRKHSEFNRYIETALRHIVFWSLPIIALVIVLRAHIVRVLLGSGEFNWDDTRLTAAALAIFITTLTLQAILLLLTRAFYAGGRTLLPLLITLAGVTIGTLAAFTSYHWIRTSYDTKQLLAQLLRLQEVTGIEVLALPIGFVLGTIFQALTMIIAMRVVFKLPLRNIGRSTLIAFSAAAVGGMVSYATLLFVVEGINQATFVGIFLQAAAATTTGLVAIVITYYSLRSTELSEVYRSFKARLFKTDVVAPQPDVL